MGGDVGALVGPSVGPSVGTEVGKAVGEASRVSDTPGGRPNTDTELAALDDLQGTGGKAKAARTKTPRPTA